MNCLLFGVAFCSAFRPDRWVTAAFQDLMNWHGNPDCTKKKIGGHEFQVSRRRCVGFSGVPWPGENGRLLFSVSLSQRGLLIPRNRCNYRCATFTLIFQVERDSTLLFWWFLEDDSNEKENTNRNTGLVLEDTVFLSPWQSRTGFLNFIRK